MKNKKIEYEVILKEQKGKFCLFIPELFIYTEGDDLYIAYQDIVKQKEKGKPFSEIIDETEALNRRTEKRAAEMKKQMAEDFDYIEELALDEKLKTTPEHFQGMKETKYSNYTVKMLGDETNKLQRWVEKELKKSLEESKKAGQEAVEKAQAKITL